jgi:FKBP-type peptidyl-prolyl cis-trans isomerase
MTKKEISVVLIVCLVLVGFIVGGVVWWSYFRTSPKPPQDNEIPSYTEDTQPATGSLRVATDEAGNSLGQLTDNQQLSGSDDTPTASTRIPGPETFKSFDKYATSTEALFADLQVGSGAEASGTSQVAIYYKGYLTNGKLFDQTSIGEDGKLQPLIFTVGGNQVIPGMEQDILGMKVGGTRRMVIPPSLGYGEQGNDIIPPNSVLIFDVQLIAVQ